MDKIIFDGKWTFETEWKESTLTTLNYGDGSQIQLRTAHQNNFIYVLIDFVTDTHLDKGSDSATICFESYSKENSTNPRSYCFVSFLDGKRSFILEKDPFKENNFSLVQNVTGFIGNSTSSDQNDRYSAISHSTYEFRVPTDLVSRSDVYRFYMGVYDAHDHKMYTWPQDLTVDSLFIIPDHSQWGKIVSPDESLPEFILPLFQLLPGTIFVIYFTKLRYR